MDLTQLLFFGIIFNIIIALVSRGFRTYTMGVDSLPAVPIAAGFAFGASAGIWTAVIVSVLYHIVRIRTIHYAPLTILVNIVVAFFASLLGFAGLFAAGIILLVVYHLLSGIIVSILGGLKTGYFSFVLLNMLTTTVLLYALAPFV